MGSIHTMEYDSAMKRREILTQATRWMNLEDIMFNNIFSINMVTSGEREGGGEK